MNLGSFNPFGELPHSNSHYGFNLNTDAVLDLAIDGHDFPPLLLTEFSPEPVNEIITYRPVTHNGAVIGRYENRGWRGTFTAARANGALDTIEEAFTKNARVGVQLYGAITETIRNVDGSFEKHIYTDVVFSMKSAGSRSFGQAISQTFEWFASNRVINHI